jgi:hypothetical protein
MKRILIFLFVVSIFKANAQKEIVWFDWGIKLQGGPRGFYSQDIEKQTKINHELGLLSGTGIGLKLGVNWQYQGLSLEGFYNKASQGVENLNGPSYTYDWNAIDIYPLYRNAQNLGYLELGPKVSMLSKMNKVAGNNTTDVTTDFNKMTYGGVLGFGANIMGNEGAFSGILGLRFEYGFTDLVKAGNLAHPLATTAPNRTTTNPYFAGVVFEFNFGIGYFGRAQCGARSKFIMF